MDGLQPNRKYDIIVMVNTRFCPKEKLAEPSAKKTKNAGKKRLPQDNPDVMRLSRAGCTSVVTAPSVPYSPHILAPDIMHYDHTSTPDKGGRLSDGNITKRTATHDQEEVVDDSIEEGVGMSVVDRLEQFKKEKSMKKSTKPRAAGKNKGTHLYVSMII